MSSVPTTIPVPAGLWSDHDRKDANAARAAAADRDACTTCGRGIRPGSGWWVHAVLGGNLLLAETEWDGYDWHVDAGYLGLLLLGPECGRKVPAAFRRPATPAPESDTDESPEPWKGSGALAATPTEEGAKCQQGPTRRRRPAAYPPTRRRGPGRCRRR